MDIGKFVTEVTWTYQNGKPYVNGVIETTVTRAADQGYEWVTKVYKIRSDGTKVDVIEDVLNNEDSLYTSWFGDFVRTINAPNRRTPTDDTAHVYKDRNQALIDHQNAVRLMVG